MAGQRITFDPNQYDQLLAQVQALVTELRSCLEPGADITLGPELELQPEPQQWNVSADMVAAGRGFGRTLDALGGVVLDQLEELRDGLVSAKSVFEDATDLASVTAAEWGEEFPGLAPTPA